MVSKAPPTIRDYFKEVKKENNEGALEQLKDVIDRVKKGDWSEVTAMMQQRVTKSRRTIVSGRAREGGSGGGGEVWLFFKYDFS